MPEVAAGMSYTTSLLDGIAQLVADQGLATYRTDGVYADTDTGITISVVPEAPDRILCLTAYAVEDTDLTDAITGVQARIRAGRDPRELDTLADGLFDLLHNRQNYVLGGVRVALSWRQSQALMGQDEHGRMELAANYYLRTTRPGSHLYE